MLEFKAFPPLLVVIFSFQLSSLISLHNILPLPWAGTSALGHGWWWQCSPLHPAHVHGHTASPHMHPPSQGINRAQMLYPHSFGSKPAKSLMLRGGRHAWQGLKIPWAQVKESSFHPSLAHICFEVEASQAKSRHVCL